MLAQNTFPKMELSCDFIEDMHSEKDVIKDVTSIRKYFFVKWVERI